MGWRTEYYGETEVEDDDGEVHKLTLMYRTYETHDTREEPGDYEEYDHEYELDGKSIDESELPEYVTAQIIESLKFNARSRGYTGH
jgi:hypothetical protein